MLADSTANRLYLQLVETALEDSIVTDVELAMGTVSTYQSALIAALDDEVITEDEWALLDHLRRLLSIQPDQHAMIEEAIHAMAEVDERGQRRIERLERFMTVCPL